MNSIISCASQTHKKDKPNQDFCITFENSSLNIKGVIVSDGIGSHAFSEISSRFCTERLKEKLQTLEKLPIDFKTLFYDIKKELEEFVINELSKDDLNKTSLGTTLICAVETLEEYQIAYVGNGSIWQISGNFNHFGKAIALPWNSINLLNPHTIEQKGKSVLYKYISIAEVSTIPSIIKLSKNEDAFGDIIIITSDGIYTSDEAKIGKDDNGVIWEMGEDTMIELYKTLDIFFSNNPIEANNNDLEFELNRYLTLLRERDIMDDDTTLGLIISPKTIEYQQNEWNVKSQKEQNDIDNSINSVSPIEEKNNQFEEKIISENVNDETNTDSKIC